MRDSTFHLELCRGVETGECPHVQPLGDPELADKLAAVVRESGWSERLRATLPEKIHRHRRLNIVLAGCANGCSRPAIADLGLLRARRPSLARPEACVSCGVCVEACPDKALEAHEGRPFMNAARCLACGHCIDQCPEGALAAEAEGWRAQIGGRLGRRPRLAEELPGLFDDAQALDLARRAIERLMDSGARRLADLVEARGADWIAGERNR